MTDPQHVEQPTRAELHMVVTRADGRVEDLGIVAAHYRNPVRAAWWLLIRRPLANRRIRRANRRTHIESTRG